MKITEKENSRILLQILKYWILAQKFQNNFYFEFSRQNGQNLMKIPIYIFGAKIQNSFSNVWIFVPKIGLKSNLNSNADFWRKNSIVFQHFKYLNFLRQKWPAKLQIKGKETFFGDFPTLEKWKTNSDVIGVWWSL